MPYFCRLGHIIYYEPLSILHVELYIYIHKRTHAYIPTAAAHDDAVLAIRCIEMGQRFLGLIDQAIICKF